ncbi:hypothetical protein F4Y93_06170 [Candidatus Poribacteria bacterium]|nr:hypothetical protein [Candidatus Poribacteria bacterium]
MRFIKCLLVLLLIGCSPYNQHVAQNAMDDFASALRKHVESQVEIERFNHQLRLKRQLRDQVVGKSIRFLGKPDIITPSSNGKVIGYLWFDKGMSDAMVILGTPDRTGYHEDIIFYVWGSYAFAEDYDIGLACVQIVGR